MVITKLFKTLRQAETYQWKLYSQYESVIMERSPYFHEDGYYTWRCAGKI